MGVAVVPRQGTGLPRPAEGAEHARPVAHERGVEPLQGRMRWIFGAAAALVVALVVSLAVRPVGSYFAPVDGWGVAALELSMGALCIARYFESSWRSSTSVARLFPLLVGVGCLAWGLGDAVLALESLGGATPSSPSAADALLRLVLPHLLLGVRSPHRAGRPELPGVHLAGRADRRTRRGRRLGCVPGCRGGRRHRWEPAVHRDQPGVSPRRRLAAGARRRRLRRASPRVSAILCHCLCGTADERGRDRSTSSGR